MRWRRGEAVGRSPGFRVNSELEYMYVMADGTRTLRTAEAEEAKRIHDLVRESAAPGIHAFELEFGEDSTGDPAVWIWLEIDPSYPTEREAIRQLSHLRRRVKAALLGAGLERIPYVRFREKPAAPG